MTIKSSTHYDDQHVKAILKQVVDAVNAGGSGGGDFVKVDGGEATDPVDFIDITLPADSTEYILALRGLAPGEAGLYCAFSFDDGETFLSDQLNSDTYVNGGAVGYMSMDGNDNTADLTINTKNFSSGDLAKFLITTGSGETLNKNATVPPVIDAVVTTLRIWGVDGGPVDPNNISGDDQIMLRSWTLYKRTP